MQYIIDPRGEPANTLPLFRFDSLSDPVQITPNLSNRIFLHKYFANIPESLFYHFLISLLIAMGRWTKNIHGMTQAVNRSADRARSLQLSLCIDKFLDQTSHAQCGIFRETKCQCHSSIIKISKILISLIAAT